MSKRTDRLLLALQQGSAWLNHIDGIGIMTAEEAQTAGLVMVSPQERPRRYTGSLDNKIVITAAGRERLNELLAERERRAEEELAAEVERLGRCCACGSTVEKTPIASWRCSNDGCVLHRTPVPASYWLAIKAAFEQQAQEHEERLDWMRQHGPDCRCRECAVP